MNADDSTPPAPAMPTPKPAVSTVDATCGLCYDRQQLTLTISRTGTTADPDRCRTCGGRSFFTVLGIVVQEVGSGVELIQGKVIRDAQQARAAAPGAAPASPASQLPDLEAIWRRNENSKNTHRGAPLCKVCGEQHCVQVEEDTTALFIEVKRLRRIVEATNPCPNCQTIHLVEKG